MSTPNESHDTDAARDALDIDLTVADAEAVRGGSTGAGAGKVTFNPLAQRAPDASIAGDPSQWG